MCGRCRQVFNAFQSLSRVEEPTETQVADLQEAVAESAESEPDHDLSADFSAIAGETETVADRLFLREEPLPLPAGFSALKVSPQTVFAPTDLSGEPTGSVVDPHPAHEASTEEIAVTQLPADIVAPIEPAIDLSDDENPLLVHEPIIREAPSVGVSRAWLFGVFILLLGLLGQAAYAFRSTLISNYPQLRPTAAQLCEFADCKLSWKRDESALKIEFSELIEAPGKPGRILLTATLVNRGETKQDLPSLELRLTDNANQVVASRLLHPVDYLGRTLAKDEGLVPSTELYVNLNLELSNKPLASGYGLIVFYP